MRYPAFLKEHGTVGFLAPSFGCATEPYKSAFDNALRKIQELGFQVKLGKNCYASDGIGISSTPENCAKEVMDSFSDEEMDVLISCGGGELMCGILEDVDFETLKKLPPKWYMGFSDNTNLTFLLTTLCDTASIYGPCAPAFGMEPWHISVQDAWEVLTGRRTSVNGYDLWEKEGGKDEEHPLLPYQVTEPRVLRSFQAEGSTQEIKRIDDVDIEGRLLGGCMDCLVNLTGTRFDKVTEFVQRYQGDGILWFLESCDLNVFGIRRALWQMEQAGWFAHVKGFLIGRPLCFGQEIMGLDHYNAVTGILGKYGVPIIMDLDIGHYKPMMPLVCGSVGKVSVRKNEVEIKMELR